jgi:hypothetical protein
VQSLDSKLDPQVIYWSWIASRQFTTEPPKTNHHRNQQHCRDRETDTKLPKRDHQQEHQKVPPTGTPTKTTNKKRPKKHPKDCRKRTRNINNQANITNRGPLTGKGSAGASVDRNKE